MRIQNDPFKAVVRIVKRRYPKLKARIYFCEPSDLKKGTKGMTVFPDGGQPPGVFISAALPIVGALDILAHELAHVVMGPKPKGGPHGREWKRIYRWIYKTYCAEVAES